MEYFESAVLEYKDMTPEEQLNYFRNLHYDESDNTEAGVVANAINDILPKYTAFTQEQNRHTNLKEVVRAIRKLLRSSLFSWVETEAAIPQYEEVNGEFELTSITFIHKDCVYQDKVIVDSHEIVAYKANLTGPENTNFRQVVMFGYNGWEELLELANA